MPFFLYVVAHTDLNQWKKGGFETCYYKLVEVGLSGILKGKQKIGLTFDSDTLGGIDFTKFSKLTMCSAGASRCWLVQWPGLPPRHCTFVVLEILQNRFGFFINLVSPF